MCLKFSNFKQEISIEIYIESRGFSQDDDYRWLKVTEESQTRIDKQDLPTIIK
ncbi:hypothetical protein [Okeania sp. KiyG1]|uniref:hypothetical protein n=1 Tax=Okeania sp. KiyG1 TaxID=2720165 RepID=UPI00192269F3|nr:hypothetical protein [Okeania sp. KiyG1]GGA21188.1 hypothetical protein CYANOKiyG1_36100 [Okeania sp. KiyG1]